MSKLLSSKVYMSYLPDGKVAVSFIADDKYVANMFVRELEHLDKIEVNAKQHKSSRSLQQNKLLWALISRISDELNGEHTEDSTMKIYADLLVKAQVKRDLVALLPGAVDKLKSMVRAVIPTGQSITSTNEKTGKIATLNTYWVYYGSSKFNVKEMNELIDITIAYASSLGIVDSEIESLRVAYEV